MFGISFFELLLVMVVAIIALGPDKLPNAIIQTISLFKGIKRTINDVRENLEDEINIQEVKKDMDSYQQHIEYTKNEIMNNTLLSSEETKQAIDKIEYMSKPITEEKPSTTSTPVK